MKIFIGTDHAGFELKEKLASYLKDAGHEVKDFGAFSFDAEDDYPDFIAPVAKAVTQEPNSRGVIIGGSGQGEAISANRVQGVRAMTFYGPMSPKGVVDADGRESNEPYEIVKLARMHNDANIISIGTRFVTPEQAKEAVSLFLNTSFSGDTRHVRRINKIDKIN